MRSLGPGKSSVVKTAIVATFLALLILMAPAKLHASTMDYNFQIALTDASNHAYDGTATFTLALSSAPVTTTDYSYTQTGAGYTVALTALDITINNGGTPESFNLGDAGESGTIFVHFSAVPTNATVGSLYTVNDINFTDIIDGQLFSIADSSRYTFDHRSNLQQNYSQEFGDYFTTNQATLESITTPDSPTVTPEPGSFFLLGTGLLGGAGSLYRRFKTQRS